MLGVGKWSCMGIFLGLESLTIVSLSRFIIIQEREVCGLKNSINKFTVGYDGRLAN